MTRVLWRLHSVVRWRRLFGHAGNLARLHALQLVSTSSWIWMLEPIQFAALGGDLFVELLHRVFGIGETAFQGLEAIVKLLTMGLWVLT